MFQVRFHGRGGQGAVTGAEMLSVAAFLDGKYAQAFPSFGSERMGAPVAAFCRIDDHEIRLREPVVDADALVIQDATLLHSVDIFQGLKQGGFVLLNTTKPLEGLGLGDLLRKLPAHHARAIAASDMAQAHLGRPLPNCALLGGLAALTAAVTIASVFEAIRGRFHGALRDGNLAAAMAAYDAVTGAASC
jgi:pyruvate ferredoxin oxidoreductase gamma subunit